MPEPASRGDPAPGIALDSIRFLSDHGIMKGCEAGGGWSNAGAPCPEPEWTRAAETPMSHSMGEQVHVELALRIEPGGPELQAAALRGKGPEGLSFRADLSATLDGPSAVRMVTRRKLARKIRRLPLDITWSAPAPGARAEIVPARTSNVVYVTMDRPRDDRQDDWQEDGVTLKRMETAVSWVAPLDTLDPHKIAAALLGRFPTYTLQPSPKVPRRYRHPQYFNNEGGAWAMADYVEETGECQAIARLIRGILRQLGVPGELRIVLVWADPGVDGGRTAIEADWEQDPSAGLDATAQINGRRCVAALVDSPVKQGQEYPPSHTRLEGGRVTPGLNRYEAFLKLTHNRKVMYYAPGAGIFRKDEPKLRVFWGLVWVSATPGDGFRVEEIVARYS